MKPFFRILLKIVVFLPAVLLTAIMTWIFHGFSDIPLSMWLLTATFWISGILLFFGQFYGGIVAMILPIADYIYSLSGYSGMRHVDTLPYILLLGVFFFLCGYFVFKSKQN